MSTRRSLFFSFLDRYASLLISVLSSMLIARLLTPTEIGVYSVVMVLLIFASTVRDMGTGQYLVQERNLTTERIRAVWAVQLFLGAGLAGVVWLASQPVATFYNEPRMRAIMGVVALNYLVNPLGSLTYAWLIREMRFEAVAMMRFASALSGALLGNWLAWHHYGPISLALGSLLGTLVNALMAVYFRPRSFPWLPGLAGVRQVLRFGSHLTLSALVGVMAGSLPELLLGKLQSLGAAGLYSRASGLVLMFNKLLADAVGTVCLPWFARRAREQGSFTEPFLKATAYVAALGWSFCFFIVCLAQPLVRGLYGHQWDPAVDLTRQLALATALQVPATLCQTALLSSGAVSTIARTTILTALQSMVFISLGASQSLFMLGFALMASAAVSSTLWLRATCQHMGLPVRHLLAMLGNSLGVAVVAALGPLAVLLLFGPYPEAVWLPLGLASLGALLGGWWGVQLFRHPLQEEIRGLWGTLKLRFFQAKPAP
jgi:O-antigen/teichoic acid export membrane protein